MKDQNQSGLDNADRIHELARKRAAEMLAQVQEQNPQASIRFQSVPEAIGTLRLVTLALESAALAGPQGQNAMAQAIMELNFATIRLSSMIAQAGPEIVIPPTGINPDDIKPIPINRNGN